MATDQSFMVFVVDWCCRRICEGRVSRRTPYLALSCVFDMELSDREAEQLDSKCSQLRPALLAGQLQSGDTACVIV